MDYFSTRLLLKQENDPRQQKRLTESLFLEDSICNILNKTNSNGISMRSILGILAGKSWFVAGGVFRSLYHRTLIKDVDVFFKSKETYLNVVNYLKSNPDFQENFQLSEDESLCYVNFLGIKYNFIGFYFKETLEDLLNTFDFACIAIGYDGSQLMTAKFSLYDLENKSLSFHKNFDNKRMWQRLDKYIRKYHFTPNLTFFQDLANFSGQHIGKY